MVRQIVTDYPLGTLFSSLMLHPTPSPSPLSNASATSVREETFLLCARFLLPDGPPRAFRVQISGGSFHLSSRHLFRFTARIAPSSSAKRKFSTRRKSRLLSTASPSTCGTTSPRIRPSNNRLETSQCLACSATRPATRSRPRSCKSPKRSDSYTIPANLRG